MMRNSRSVAGVVARSVVVLCLAGGLCAARAEPPPEREITIDLGGGEMMEFVLIPAGEFLMGSHESPEAVVKEFALPEIFVEYLKNEHPQHRVRITQPFYLGKYEVTQEQWKAVMGASPSFGEGAKNPVETVDWNDCQAFINKLNEKLGKPGVKFSLPTEAQWEYACRAGTSTRFSFGDDKASLGEYAWYGRNSEKKTHPVGQKKPNARALKRLSREKKQPTSFAGQISFLRRELIFETIFLSQAPKPGSRRNAEALAQLLARKAAA